MAINLKKFLDDEGLSLKRFGEWVERQTKGEENKDGEKGYIIPKNEELFTRFIEGTKGEKESKSILQQVHQHEAIVESHGPLLLTVKYSKGSFRVPSTMVDIKGTG